MRGLRARAVGADRGKTHGSRTYELGDGWVPGGDEMEKDSNSNNDRMLYYETGMIQPRSDHQVYSGWYDLTRKRKGAQ